MVKIILQLEDPEFLELGGLAYGYAAAIVNGRSKSGEPFNCLMDKIKEQVDRKSTPGQLLHFERIVDCIRNAIKEREVDSMMIKEGFSNVMDLANEMLTDGEG